MSQQKRRLAWVTGAGKGIGRAVALRLAGQGWIVAASARTEADLTALAAAVPANAGQVACYPLDMTDAAAVAGTVARIEAELGPIELALLNAGTHRPISAGGFDLAALRELVEVNLMGTAHGLAALMPRFMTRRAGQIAVVASVAGYRGLPTAAGYGATKAALINMCEALKPELEAAGVDLKLISPGFVATPLTARNRFPMPFLITAEQSADHILAGLGAGRFEIAFPWRMALAMRLLRLLPDRLFFAISRRMVSPAPPDQSED
ncbi:MAG: SDR family NAD(P)-dependent oxidoreductase [Rhizobiales bacterium]|nr:SDR family NAD(P)-dependent oxidoreductase [Hyphomicrobiales bacterium]